MTAASGNTRTRKSRAVDDTYLLELHLGRPKTITVGRLGRHRFSSGYYIYVGSARRNFYHRIRRHLRKKKKMHWHIDYLLKHAAITRVYSCNLAEEATAAKLARSMKVPIPHFGSSDKRSISHLFSGVLNVQVPGMVLHRVF